MPLANPLKGLPTRLRWSLAASAVILMLLWAINQPLQNASAPRGIISFQMAATADQSRVILQSWQANDLGWAIASLILDYLFIALYLTTLLLLTRHFSQDRPGIRERTLARWIRTLFITAALADVIENSLLLNNLGGTPTDMSSLGATLCALVKFTGLLTGTAGLVVLRAARRHPLTVGEASEPPRS